MDAIIDIVRNTKASSKSEAVSVVKDVLMNGNVDYLEDTNAMKKNIKLAKTFRFTERHIRCYLKKRFDIINEFPS